MNKTPWYPGHIKPVRPGVYERDFEHQEMFALFDGLVWRISSFYLMAASKQRYDSPHQSSIRWRGLKHEGAKT